MTSPSGDAALALAARILLLTAAVALAGCGVKGDLEPPPGGAQALSADKPGPDGQKPNLSKPAVPDRSLFIDKLL
jgi:predicted small lipoprotein YifL